MIRFSTEILRFRLSSIGNSKERVLKELYSISKNKQRCKLNANDNFEITMELKNC